LAKLTTAPKTGLLRITVGSRRNGYEMMAVFVNELSFLFKKEYDICPTTDVGVVVLLDVK